MILGISAILGGNWLSGSTKDTLTDALGAVGGMARFRDLIDLLANFTNVHNDIQFFIVTLDVKAQLVTQFLRSQPAFRTPRSLAIVPTKYLVAHAQPRFGRVAVGVDAANNHRAIRRAFHEEA
jgi:hypothetical protein